MTQPDLKSSWSVAPFHSFLKSYYYEPRRWPLLGTPPYFTYVWSPRFFETEKYGEKWKEILEVEKFHFILLVNISLYSVGNIVHVIDHPIIMNETSFYGRNNHNKTKQGIFVLSFLSCCNVEKWKTCLASKVRNSDDPISFSLSLSTTGRPRVVLEHRQTQRRRRCALVTTSSRKRNYHKSLIFVWLFYLLAESQLHFVFLREREREDFT